MAYDSTRQVVVLFGGQDASSHRLGDTWEWDGEGWVERDLVEGPPPRTDPAMAYDARRARVLLFGGYSAKGEESVLLDDTWQWDGSTWVEADTGDERPSARFEHALTYDRARERVVLQGGKSRRPLTRTWTWNGLRWREVDSPGPGLTAHALAYDAARERVVAVGSKETWEWDGEGWSLKAYLGGPEGLEEPAMAFDERRGVMVLFGGKRGAELQGATWELCTRPRD